MLDWLPEAVGLASAAWGAFETYRRKRAARIAREKEAARRAELARNLDGLERGVMTVQEILDRAAQFDAAWQPIPKAKGLPLRSK